MAYSCKISVEAISQNNIVDSRLRKAQIHSPQILL